VRLIGNRKSPQCRLPLIRIVGEPLVFVAEIEGFEIEFYISHAGGWACHTHCVVVADFNRDLAAGHVHGDRTIAEANSVSHRCGGTAAGARCEGVACAALPYFDLNVVAVENFEELHVGTVREARIDFDRGTVCAGELLGDLSQWHHAVWIADIGKIDGVVGAVDAQLLANIVIPPFGAVDRNVVHCEAHFSHINRDRGSTVANFAGDDAAECINGEGVVADLANVVEIAGEDAQPVAALFGFAAVWVYDPQAEVGLVAGKWPVEDAIGAEAEVAVANAHSILFARQFAGVFWVEDEVVVSERVVFREFHSD